MRRLLLAIVIALPLAALAAGGGALPGRLAFALGFPSAAAALFSDPGWKGAALYAAGRWSEAADAFAAPQQAYNRGNALARAGRLSEALAAYDAALAADPDNEDAAANRALVAALAGAGEDGPLRQGGVANADATRRIHAPRAQSALSEATSSGSGLVGVVQSKSTGPQGGGSASKSGAGDPGAARSDAERASGAAGNAGGEGRAGGMMADIARVMATRDWLAALPDDPGAFLKLRIRSEQARRKAAGPMAGDDD